MNAQRHVVQKVYKGWNLARHPLIATPLGDKKDRNNEPAPAVEENLQLAFNNEKLADIKLTRFSGLRSLFYHDPGVSRFDFDTHLGRLQCSNEQICTLFENGSNRRLDVFPVQLNDAVASQIAQQKPKHSEIQKPVTADVCVQTDAAADFADEVCSATEKIKANVENELGNEMAEMGFGKEAISAWRTAAENGSVEALYNLAMCYSNGEYVSKSADKALYLWEKASSLGHSLSAYQLAVCYINGQGSVKKDVETGRRLMEKSADLGCVEAQFYMASKLLLTGELERAEKYLLGAVRKKNFFDNVSKWPKMDSVPAHVRSIAERVVLKAGVP